MWTSCNIRHTVEHVRSISKDTVVTKFKSTFALDHPLCVDSHTGDALHGFWRQRKAEHGSHISSESTRDKSIHESSFTSKENLKLWGLEASTRRSSSESLKLSLSGLLGFPSFLSVPASSPARFGLIGIPCCCPTRSSIPLTVLKDASAGRETGAPYSHGHQTAYIFPVVGIHREKTFCGSYDGDNVAVHTILYQYALCNDYGTVDWSPNDRFALYGIVPYGNYYATRSTVIRNMQIAQDT